jgi:predicted DNA-binding transcriptional regulator YafY
VTARIPYAGTTWIARAVVARLGEAEVLAPESVRRAVVDMAGKMIGEGVA